MNWKLSVICLTLSVLACGAPVSLGDSPTLMAPVNKEVSIHTTPSTIGMVVCNSGGLNIRPVAGDLTRSLGWKHDGDTVTVKQPATVTEDMGLWYELEEGGWVNSRYLCMQ